MAGPVFNISTNMAATSILGFENQDFCTFLKKKKKGYGCFDKNTLKCHHTHLKFLAFRGTSCFCYKTIALLHCFQPHFLPASSFNTVPYSVLFRLREQNDQRQTCWCRSRMSVKPPPCCQMEGWRNGSDTGVVSLLMEVCCPTLQLERLRDMTT